MPPERDPGLRPLRFGMIGVGWMGNAIAGDFVLCPGVELAALGVRDLSRGRAFAAAHGVSDAMPVADLLAREDIDIVYIATPRHLELALDAIAAGKQVLVEKALTSTATEARTLAAAAKSAGVFLMEAMWMRFNPAIRSLLGEISAGVIGEPRTMLASFGAAVPVGHRLWDPERDGGSLLDQAVYPLTLAELVFGAPSRVLATGSTRGYDGERSGVDSEAGMLLGYPGGEQAVLATSIRTPLPMSATIGGAEGNIDIPGPFWATKGYTVRDLDGTRRLVEEPREGNGYVPMLRAVRDAITAGMIEHPWCTLEDTISVMETVDTVRRQVEA